MLEKNLIPSVMRSDVFIVLTVLKRLASLVQIWSPASARFWGLAGRFQTVKHRPVFYAGRVFWNTLLANLPCIYADRYLFIILVNMFSQICLYRVSHIILDRINRSKLRVSELIRKFKKNELF